MILFTLMVKLANNMNEFAKSIPRTVFAGYDVDIKRTVFTVFNVQHPTKKTNGIWIQQFYGHVV